MLNVEFFCVTRAIWLTQDDNIRPTIQPSNQELLMEWKLKQSVQCPMKYFVHFVFYSSLLAPVVAVAAAVTGASVFLIFRFAGNLILEGVIGNA